MYEQLCMNKVELYAERMSRYTEVTLIFWFIVHICCSLYYCISYVIWTVLCIISLSKSIILFCSWRGGNVTILEYGKSE